MRYTYYNNIIYISYIHRALDCTHIYFIYIWVYDNNNNSAWCVYARELGYNNIIVEVTAVVVVEAVEVTVTVTTTTTTTTTMIGEAIVCVALGGRRAVCARVLSWYASKSLSPCEAAARRVHDNDAKRKKAAYTLTSVLYIYCYYSCVCVYTWGRACVTDDGMSNYYSWEKACWHTYILYIL